MQFRPYNTDHTIMTVQYILYDRYPTIQTTINIPHNIDHTIQIIQYRPYNTDYAIQTIQFRLYNTDHAIMTIHSGLYTFVISYVLHLVLLCLLCNIWPEHIYVLSICKVVCFFQLHLFSQEHSHI